MASVRAHLRPTDDTHRVTNLELLFDLVFVYAITNVTAIMETHPGGRTLLEALIVLAVIWFGWCAYAWLGNQAKADEGLLRLAMVVAMTGMFFVAISIPNAFAGSGNAALVLALAFGVVRMVHVGVYLIAAGDNQGLRSVVIAMGGLNVITIGLLIVGAEVGPPARVWWWLAGVVVDQSGVFFARSNRWVLNSASHFAERFGLIVIIAIGESIVGVGNASAVAHLDLRLGTALVCGVAIAVCLWWRYFDVVALVAEEVLSRSAGLARARLARDSYTYIHLPMIAGIVLSAMGLHFLVEGHHHIDAGRYALYGGIALYLLAHLLFRLRNIGSVNQPRAVAMVLILVLIPLTGRLPALAQLAIPAVLLITLICVEVRRFRDWRQEVRQGDPADSGGGESGRPQVEESAE